MDGVLIDSEKYYFERRMNFFKEIDQKPGSTKISDYIGKTEKQIWQLLASNPQQRKELYPLYQSYRQIHPIDFCQILNPDALSIIEQLYNQGIKIAIASSSPKDEIERMIQITKINQYLDLYISGEDLQESKPHPEIYQITSKRLDVKCLAVEDSVVGIKSAVAAGLFTLALKQQYPIDQTQANATIDSLLEILEYLC